MRRLKYTEKIIYVQVILFNLYVFKFETRNSKIVLPHLGRIYPAPTVTFPTVTFLFYVFQYFSYLF